MKAKDMTVEWLQGMTFTVQSRAHAPTIDGVRVRNLTVHLDGRGDVTELWSRPWKVEGFVHVEHVYQSSTDYGVIKCWHLHELHTDQLAVTRGKLQLSLADVREDSPSFGHVNTFFLGSLQPCLIKIPPMVMHGWKALSSPEVVVTNMQSHVFDPVDEYKFPWNCVLTHIWEPRNG